LVKLQTPIVLILLREGRIGAKAYQAVFVSIYVDLSAALQQASPRSPYARRRIFRRHTYFSAVYTTIILHIPDEHHTMFCPHSAHGQSSQSSSRSYCPSPPMPFKRKGVPTSSAFANGNWRMNRNPSPPRPGGMPLFQDIRFGEVFFLGSVPPPESSVVYAKLAAKGNPWGHPVVVVGKHVSAGVEHVKLRVCTSFGSRRVEDARPRCQHQYLLIENQEDVYTHQGTSLVRLSSSSAATFRKRTYISLRKKGGLTIEYQHLEPFEGGKLIRLDMTLVSSLA
jgi:hypothetical protein